jgi:hypothetical protein
MYCAQLQADSWQPHNTGLLRLRTIKTGDTEELDALPLANSANFSLHPSPHTPQHTKFPHTKTPTFTSNFQPFINYRACEFRRSFSPRVQYAGKIPFKDRVIFGFFASAFLQNFHEMMKKHRHRMGLFHVLLCEIRGDEMREQCLENDTVC